MKYLEEIVYFFIVDLQKGAEDVGIAEFLHLLEDLMDRTGDNPCTSTVILDLAGRILFLRLVALAEHSVCLP